MSDDEPETVRWWGQPLKARRYHVFEGEGALANSLCNSGWAMAYGDDMPEVDPDGDTFRDGKDCKECSRRAGVLEEGGCE